MNFSPLNDPGFEEYRKREAAKAAKARKKRTLIILAVTAVIAAAGAVLLVLAAFDAVPRIIDNFSSTTPPAENTPTAAPSGSPETPTPQVLPTEATPSPTPSPTPDVSPTTEDPSVVKPTVKVRTTTVYLDPGHGFLNAAGDAMDKGAGNPDYIYYKMTEELYGAPMYEADMVLILTKKVKALLEDAGYTVVMSREDYVYERVPVALRAAKAKEADADLLVSIHANSAADTSAYGARVYYNDNPAWSLSIESKHFADDVAKSIDAYGASRKKSKVYGDGESGKTLAMLRGTGDIPSVLIETCFLTNEEDAKAAISEEWQDSMAKAIVQAIVTRYKLKTTIL